MKRYAALLTLLLAGLFSPLASASISGSQAEELQQIVSELKSLSEEQETIIQNSQKRNEELGTASNTWIKSRILK
jgi:predicted PurR-regulated permease PerM